MPELALGAQKAGGNGSGGSRAFRACQGRVERQLATSDDPCSNKQILRASGARCSARYVQAAARRTETHESSAELQSVDRLG